MERSITKAMEGSSVSAMWRWAGCSIGTRRQVETAKLATVTTRGWHVRGCPGSRAQPISFPLFPRRLCLAPPHLSALSSPRLSLPRHPPDDCEVGAGGARKACKNCSCGRAEAEAEAEAGGGKAKLTADMLDNPTSACGNVSRGAGLAVLVGVRV